MRRLIILLATVMAVLAIPQKMMAYDFSSVSPSGHTLYYNVVNGCAQVTCQNTGIIAYSNLTGHLIIPDSVPYSNTKIPVTSISDTAFKYCYNLTQVDIPATVTTIGNRAFQSCIGLNIVYMWGVISIGNNAFYNCSSLYHIYIPNTTTTIGQYAFARCGNLFDIEIPNSVTSIGSYAFECDTSLQLIYNMQGITTISEGLFWGCSNIRTRIIPSSISSIGNYAFYRCSKLNTVTLHSGITDIGDFAFAECDSLTSIALPNTVNHIGAGAFRRCIGFTSISIPDSVLSVGAGAFDSCTNLTTATIGCDTIKVGTFNDCVNLSSITIGQNVKHIVYHAFSGCGNLDTVTLLPEIAPSMNYGAFDENTDRMFFIPCGSYDLYYDYSPRIEPDAGITISVFSENEAYGAANIVQIRGVDVSCDSTCTIIGVPNDGFCFNHWSDGNTDNPRTLFLFSDTTLFAHFVNCDSCNSRNFTLPYAANFTQCWTATGGATIIDNNHASITSQGQTLTSPWINVPAGTVYYHFIDRRDTTGAYWNSWDSAVWYSVSIEDADGGIITTANWDSETSSQGKISHFMASGGPIRFVFTYTDTHAVQLHYIENLEIYAYDMSLTVEGPTSVNVGDTVVYVAHVSMPEGDYPDNWYWCLYNQYYSMVDSTNATIIATTDSTRTIVWHASGNYQLFAEVKKYIPQMVWQYLYYNITVLDTTPPTPVDCDSITLPYTADFTQCWTAEGAVVIDPNHVSMISVGQKITSPWMESYPGKTFLHWDQQREGTLDYNSEQFTITIESETGVIASWLEYAADWSLTSTFTSPGGRIRVTFEYTGSNPVPSYQITGVNLYQYEIENTIEAPVIAHVGDTVMFTAHATLQNGETPDYYEWNMYDSFGNWMNEDDSARTIISRTDSTLLVVWNSHGRYQVSCDINKYNVYNDADGSYSAYAHAYQNINIVDHDFFEADSIYYTSAAKDTVIGCHPDLHVANLPESVTVIFDSAFFNLSNLSIIELPTSLHTIGNMAFAWNQGISEITIPQNVTFVGDNAFWWDTNLTTVNFNATNCQTMSPSTDNNGNYWPVFIECDKITTINIGENVTRIPDRAFSYCNGLHGTLTIPDAVTYIGRSAFFHWIDDWDWENGSSWDTLSIVLGAGLTEIGDYAFGCPRAHITSVISHNPEPPIIGEQTFYRYEPEYTPRLQVPCGSAAAYRNAQHWSRIEEIIEDCDGIEDAENDARTPAILSDNGIITVVGATELVSVYDMMGRLVSAYMPTDFRCTIVVPHSGVYMVKIGDCPARKIVVIK